MTSGTDWSVRTMPKIWMPADLDLSFGEVDMAGCKVDSPDLFDDDRGYLLPLLNIKNPKVLYCYYSITYPGYARDMDKWHYHENHTDRFVVLRGDAVFALARNDDMQLVMLSGKSPTMPSVLTVNSGVYHCFRVYGIHSVGLLNVPDAIYDPEDEHRISFDELGLYPW